jgi:hypothetical protein
MNGMNAEECADKQGDPPIRHAGELCSYDRSPPTRSNRQICDGLRFASCAAVGAATLDERRYVHSTICCLRAVSGVDGEENRSPREMKRSFKKPPARSAPARQALSSTPISAWLSW